MTNYLTTYKPSQIPSFNNKSHSNIPHSPNFSKTSSNFQPYQCYPLQFNNKINQILTVNFILRNAIPNFPFATSKT